MKFGIDLPNYGEYADPALLLGLATEAEAAGWDGFFLWDHLVVGGRTPVIDPWVVMSAVAVRTSHIRFGPMVTPLARRRMSKLARETVTLDRLSGGRLILGVGLGHFDEQEFTAFGDTGDRTLRAQVLDESLELLDALWHGDPVDYAGAHVRAKTSPFLPLAAQQPRIPVWVAGLWPNKRPMRRAAAWDGAFPIDAAGDLARQLSPGAMADAIAYVSEHRSGDAAFDYVHAGLSSGHAARDRDLAQAYADVGVTWWLEHVYPGRMAPEVLRERIRSGPPRTT
ncbi:MAG TPA: LLM class flavin-dependent oxidoreductase [Anaerolineae bacterium]|nr:LLM class flavin-dependent oxidoreductase [Anaerolineae bacterium]